MLSNLYNPPFRRNAGMSRFSPSGSSANITGVADIGATSTATERRRLAQLLRFFLYALLARTITILRPPSNAGRFHLRRRAQRAAAAGIGNDIFIRLFTGKPRHRWPGSTCTWGAVPPLKAGSSKRIRRSADSLRKPVAITVIFTSSPMLSSSTAPKIMLASSCEPRSESGLTPRSPRSA